MQPPWKDRIIWLLIGLLLGGLLMLIAQPPRPIQSPQPLPKPPEPPKEEPPPALPKETPIPNKETPIANIQALPQRAFLQKPLPLEGLYWVNDNPGDIVVLYPLADGFYRAENAAWYGVGLFDGTHYIGIFVYRETTKDFAGVWGVHYGEPKENNTISVHGTNLQKIDGSFDIVWKKASNAPEGGVPSPCPEGWSYSAFDEKAGLCQLQLAIMPPKPGDYCLYVNDGYLGFTWTLKDAPAYQCPTGMRQSDNGSGDGFCTYSLDREGRLKGFALSPKCDPSKGVLGFTLQPK